MRGTIQDLLCHSWLVEEELPAQEQVIEIEQSLIDESSSPAVITSE